MNFDLGFTALLVVTAAAVGYAVWRGRRQSTIFEKVEQVTAQVNELTLRVVELELELAGYRVWSSQLRGQVIELRGIPVAPPPWIGQGRPIPGFETGTAKGAETPLPTDSTLVRVFDLLVARFALEEVNELAFRVGIDPDDLDGVTLTERSKALVLHAAKHLMMSKLVGTAALMRPDVDWPPVAAGNGVVKP